MLKLQHELQENKLRLSNQELALSNAQKRNLLLLLINGLMLCIGVAYYLNRRTRKQHIHYLYTKEKLVEQWIAEERSLRQDISQEQWPGATAEETVTPENLEVEEEKYSNAALFKDLIFTIEQKKMYLNPELNLKNVISILRTNRTYLNKAIQSNGEGNFKQIINRYRVEEAKRLLEKYVQDKSNENIEQFYIMAGFNSISSYYRVFRNITGLTPKEYVQEYARDIRQ
jgi:YesN/AraC family two-component response regulator